MNPNPFRSVGARLSLALLLVVAGSLAVVYLVVVPSLENRLIDRKLDQLETRAPALKDRYTRRPNDPDFFEDAEATTNARIVLFKPLTLSPAPVLTVVEDTRGGKNSSDVQSDPIAVQASLTGRTTRGTAERSGERFAEVAIVIDDESTLLLSASLRDADRDVSLVRERLLIAGGLVLGLVFVVGYGGSWLFARRIRQLERAADRIASGRFDEPVTDLGKDEVGELARAFERMRLRLAQLDHARREFIANASHELRTPLFSLGGFLELLDDEELDEETRREFLTTMREQVTRLSKLATELLDLSRLDAGHLEVLREPVSLAAVAREIAAEFAAVAKQTEHDLDVRARGDAVALADGQRVLQIARALVENALVHTPPGVSVLLTTSRSSGGASLTVVDDGPGIPPEPAPHVFERFYRGEGSRAAGSGLGLAIALELARLMGGTIVLDSVPGRTEFRLTLPDADLLSPPPRPRLEPVRA